ncbi:MAG: Lrp/AsnC family transcriptional regulator [Peptostreptococcaceae bacterium]|nr:Lrp/AsnC family transcriptional regulator [Peptostreptococcaceae bacterium]
MDNTDIKILKILQNNCKATLKDISTEVNLTSPAVMERIRKLKDDNVINGYYTSLNFEKFGMTITALISVDVNQKKYETFCKFCREEELIITHHHIIGPYNAMLQVIARDSSNLSNLLKKLNFFGTTQTSIILDTLFSNEMLK